MEDLAIRILLIYPEVASFFIDKPYLLYGLAPPLGLLYIGAMLEQEGHTVTEMVQRFKIGINEALDNFEPRERVTVETL